MKLILTLFAWMLACVVTKGENASGQAEGGSALKVLFIGNSLTFYNDLPEMVRYMGEHAVPPLPMDVDSITMAGATLKRHWEKGEALKSIREGGWDCVVLQGQSLEAVADQEGFFAHVRLFDAEIRKGGAKTLLYMTWALQRAPQDQQRLTDAYRRIGGEIGARVVPVGVARESLLELRPEAPIYHRDGKHPTPQGSYLAACLFHAMLSGQSPEGLPVEIPMPEKQGKMLARLNPKDAAIFQEVAGKAAESEARKWPPPVVNDP
jgi:hypothetical protein